MHKKYNLLSNTNNMWAENELKIVVKAAKVSIAWRSYGEDLKKNKINKKLKANIA